MSAQTGAKVVSKGDWKVTMTPDDIYRNPMDIAWTFDYMFSEDKVEDLYKRAKQNQWDSDDLLPWDTVVDPSRPLIANDSDIYHKMPFFKRLSKSQQETFTAHSTAQLLSQFLHGEQGALMTAACVTHSVPDEGAKLYAATQTMDEARHVEVYSKYCDKIAIIYPMSPWLKQLIDVTLQSDRYEKVMIGMNMIVEGLALGAFNNMYRTTTCPLLKQLTFNVMRDESRHVSFGHVFLGPVFKKMHADDLEELAEFAFQAVNILVKAQTAGTIANKVDPGFMQVLENSGIDADDFFKGLKEAEEAGLTRDLPPGQVHALKDLMMPALARVGLLTPTARKKYDEAGIPVFDDIRVLQAMEGGHPTGEVAAE
ncbi:MAG: ferritin-like domain-containing protein [Parvibaculum sp.]|uniref:ferritin-like domain-containing protein n=1 Tax=Parvibaculum sp. TaxID=2024848 RepID=UPI00271AE6B7|nr:ferritin-like domain-containing protein [Parvibaculum sp.]MDO8839061.1 ferritin-like domain-containing protein [Parvibaculum sp.]